MGIFITQFARFDLVISFWFLMAVQKKRSHLGEFLHKQEKKVFFTSITICLIDFAYFQTGVGIIHLLGFMMFSTKSNEKVRFKEHMEQQLEEKTEEAKENWREITEKRKLALSFHPNDELSELICGSTIEEFDWAHPLDFLWITLKSSQEEYFLVVVGGSTGGEVSLIRGEKLIYKTSLENGKKDEFVKIIKEMELDSLYPLYQMAESM